MADAGIAPTYPYNSAIAVEYRKCDECGNVWRGNNRRRRHTDRPDCPKCYHRGPKIIQGVRRTWQVITRQVPAYRCRHCHHAWVPNLRARRPDATVGSCVPPHCPKCRRTAL